MKTIFLFVSVAKVRDCLEAIKQGRPWNPRLLAAGAQNDVYLKAEGVWYHFYLLGWCNVKVWSHVEVDDDMIMLMPNVVHLEINFCMFCAGCIC